MGLKLDKMESLKSEQAVFRYKGKKCVILKIMKGHFCAYVETKLRLGYSELGPMSPDSFIRCHGGVTFAGELKGHKEWFFGMDFAHAGDRTRFPDIDIVKHPELKSVKEGHEEDHDWTLEEVKMETEKLADEVIQYETDPEIRSLVERYQKLLAEIENVRALR
jgi:hypothetical protein